MNTLFELKDHHITICIPKNLKHSETKKPNLSVTRFIRKKKNILIKLFYISDSTRVYNFLFYVQIVSS